MEDYKKKYEEVLKKAKAIHNLAIETSHKDTRMVIEELFYELKESEGERIRKEIISYIKSSGAVTNKQWIAWLEKQSTPQTRTGIEWVNIIDDACDKRYSEEYSHGEYCHEQSFRWGFQEGVDWLEKQGEQKYTDKVEPKFKVGDYIINEHGFIMQIDGINSNTYIYHVLDNTDKKLTYDITKTDKSCHLWTIKDAKDGDIVASHKIIILFKKFQENGSNCSYVIAYGGIDIFGKLQITDGEWMLSNDVKPASKEQRDILFSKMKKAGYKWDAKKKELKKIKQKLVELSEICNYLECQKREEYSRKNILDKWIVFLKSLNIEEVATEGTMVQINRVLNVLDWAEKKGRLSHSNWEDCYTIIASLKYRLKK